MKGTNMKSTTMNDLRNPKAGLEALLTPDNCLLTLIDHQPFQFANLHSHEPTMVVNNVISLAKTAKVFGEPAILTTVLEERVGFLIKGLRFWLMGSICIAALTRCAHSKQAGAYGKAKPSGFLKDYSKLRAAADETEPTLVYVRPD